MKDTFRYQGVADQSELAAYFRALAEGLERGEFVAAENDRTFSLSPRGLMRLTLKARRKEGRSRIIVALNWDEEAPPTPLLDDLEEGAQ